MARLHAQARAAGQCDSHCRVIDSHDLHHTDDTNHAGREEEYKLANVRISKGLSPYDAVRIIRGALWDEVPSGEPKRGRCLPLVLIDATTIRDNMLIRETNWDVMPGNVRREFEKID